MDQDETWHAGRSWPWPHYVRWGPSSPPPKGRSSTPNFRSRSVVAKWLDGLRCHLVWRLASAQATVLDGTQLPLPRKGAERPNFWPMSIVANGWMDQDGTWHGGDPRPRRHCVRWGPSSPQRGITPKFSAHAYWGQTARWNKMKLNGMEVGLCPGDIVLYGNPAAPSPL